MDRKNLQLFRYFFDQELFKDGFVWKHQTYMHVDFEQGWYLAIWPYSFAEGHMFNIQFCLSFFHECFPAEDFMTAVKTRHRYQWQEMFLKFHLIPSERDGCWTRLLWLSEEDIQLSLKLYQQHVSPVLHDIHSIYDACQFKKQYEYSYYPEMVLLPEGKCLIMEYLMINQKQEALAVIPSMFGIVQHWMSLSNKRFQETLKSQPEHCSIAKRRFEQEQETYHQKCTEIEQFKNAVFKDQLGDEIQKTVSTQKRNAALLKKGFTKKEILQMADGWKLGTASYGL